MVYFDQILHSYACQQCGMRNNLFLKDRASLSINLAGRCQLVKMLITLEPRCIFGSNFAYLYTFLHCTATGIQNGDEASPSINLASRGIFVKMLVTLEPHGIF